MPTIPGRIAWAVDLLDIRPDDRILEIGCGNGAALSLIAPLLETGTATGLDRSAMAISRASAVNAAHLRTGRVRLIHGTVADLPPDDEPYQAVFAVNVNAFWLRPDQELPAVRRLLAPGGVLALVLEAPGMERARDFLAAMPGHLAAHGFDAIETLTRNERTVCIRGETSA